MLPKAAPCRPGEYLVLPHACPPPPAQHDGHRHGDAQQPGTARSLLIAVTVLTSLADADLPAIGGTGSVAEQLERLATLAELRRSRRLWSPPVTK